MQHTESFTWGDDIGAALMIAGAVILFVLRGMQLWRDAKRTRQSIRALGLDAPELEAWQLDLPEREP